MREALPFPVAQDQRDRLLPTPLISAQTLPHPSVPLPSLCPSQQIALRVSISLPPFIEVSSLSPLYQSSTLALAPRMCLPFLPPVIPSAIQGLTRKPYSCCCWLTKGCPRAPDIHRHSQQAHRQGSTGQYLCRRAADEARWGWDQGWGCPHGAGGFPGGSRWPKRRGPCWEKK